MDIHEYHALGRAHLLADDGAQRAVRPDGLAPAELHAVGMCVLAGAERVLHRGVAVPVRIGFHLLPALRHRFGREVARVDCVHQFLVAGVFRVRFRVVEEVAVEVHIVLVHPPVPREAVRGDRMDEDQRRVRRQVASQTLAQKRGLDAGAAIAFHAMRAGTDAENISRVLRPDPRDIRREHFALGAR